MNKLIPATLAVTAVLAFSPAFAGENTITAAGATTTSASATAPAAAATATPAATTTAPAAVTPAVTTPATAAQNAATDAAKAMTAAPSEGAMSATTEEDATPEETKVQSYILKDGTNVTVLDNKAFTVSADGTKKPVADGDLVTKDGVTLKVKDGTIVTDGATPTSTTATAATKPSPESAPMAFTNHIAKPADSAPMSSSDKKPDAAPKE